MLLPSKDRWIIRSRPNPQTRLRLFCLPYAGGGASTYFPWLTQLPAHIELCAIQLPGRETRLDEAPIRNLDLLVKLLTNAIRPYCDIPFAIFGHSMGSLLGFELTRQLRREQYPSPLQLFASGGIAPQISITHPSIHELPDPEFLHELRLYNGTPDEVLANEEMMQLLLPQLRADFAIRETYRYTDDEPLNCPITVFGGLQDHQVAQEHFGAWQKQTTYPLIVNMLPGDHFFINSARAILLPMIWASLL